ncbi:hypothetical protein [Mycobacterium heckeshornense]|uniref:Uncharacterized protein n=1 Tax=Mycobacterium xenopi 4042 TaxID=1299334 RepID=X8DVC5_MYCXE|nr:hypothetical protein [Mycobacterium heckeshornense]EUA17405.1 hypothetical protein I552_0606 [Mycobacterium xenopi 3993]EUA72314.1 hypothetical protein I553_10659 [Mycobacterium xenopi 4042]
MDYLHADGAHRRLVDLRPVVADQIVGTGRPGDVVGYEKNGVDIA